MGSANDDEALEDIDIDIQSILNSIPSKKKRKTDPIADLEDDDLFNEIDRAGQKAKAAGLTVEKKAKTSEQLGVSKEEGERLLNRYSNSFVANPEACQVDLMKEQAGDHDAKVRLHGAIPIFTRPQHRPSLSFEPLPAGTASSSSNGGAYQKLYNALSQQWSNAQLSDIIQGGVIQQWLNAKQLPPTGHLMKWLLKICAFHPLNELAHASLLVLRDLAADLSTSAVAPSSTATDDGLKYEDIQEIFRVFGARFLEESAQGTEAVEPEEGPGMGELLNCAVFFDALALFLENPQLHQLSSADLASLCVDLARSLLDSKTHNTKRGVPALKRCMCAAIAAVPSSDWIGEAPTEEGQGGHGVMYEIATGIHECLEGLLPFPVAEVDNETAPDPVCEEVFARVQLIRSIPVRPLPSRNGEVCLVLAHLLLKTHLLQTTAYATTPDPAPEDGASYTAGSAFKLLEAALSALLGEVPPLANETIAAVRVPNAMRFQRNGGEDYAKEFATLVCIDCMLQAADTNLSSAQLTWILYKLPRVLSRLREKMVDAIPLSRETVCSMQARCEELGRRPQVHQITIQAGFANQAQQDAPPAP